MQESMGAQAYTAYNTSISDSLRNSDGYSPHVSIKMPTEFGQNFMMKRLIIRVHSRIKKLSMSFSRGFM